MTRGQSVQGDGEVEVSVLAVVVIYMYSFMLEIAQLIRSMFDYKSMVNHYEGGHWSCSLYWFCENQEGSIPREVADFKIKAKTLHQ